ncbi:MAG: hypothetical protein WC835_03555 [Candidatus Paceibacterota bacterium]|jgi:hypothetical protein
MFFKKFSITSIVLVVVAVLVLVALGIWLGSALLGKKDSANTASPYSVVYMSSGEIYFGKLSWFPKPYISSPWTIQRQTDKDGQVQAGIVPVNKAIWSPVDGIYLNEKQIVAWSALRADGDMAKALADPKSLEQAQNPQTNGAAQSQSPIPK